eukprot:56492-Eustigmatos_ZCMA.PRE.1
MVRYSHNMYTRYTCTTNALRHALVLYTLIKFSSLPVLPGTTHGCERPRDAGLLAVRIGRRAADTRGAGYVSFSTHRHTPEGPGG